MAEPLIVAHGGAGAPKDLEGGPRKAAESGYRVLEKDGTALEAVIEATVVLEDDPRFNAGTGSYMSRERVIEMDASIMDSEGRFGAVAAIRDVKNPVLVARKVAETPHYLLVGEGATRFARGVGFKEHDCSTQKALDKLAKFEEALEKREIPDIYWRWKEYLGCDTVGAVARDREGRYAAANSTGGTSFKLPGRVGDSPIIGAGIYAGGKGAVVATGVGEDIMIELLSKGVYDKMPDLGAQGACEWGVELFKRPTSMGLIAVNGSGWGAHCNMEMARWTECAKKD